VNPPLQKPARGDRGTRQIGRAPPAKTSLGLVLLSLAAWNVGHAKWRLLNLYDLLRGKGGLAQRAVRLRATISKLGLTGTKVGEQVGMRIDLMPLQSSLALFGIDNVQRPAMDFAAARGRIEAAAGGTLEEVFDHVDPVPISSTTAYCTYRASLHGSPVAIKVRRPGIRKRFSADLIALVWINRALEAVGVWPPGFAETIQQDLGALATDRLDLSRHARCQTVFRRMARRQGPKWLTAPKVHAELSNHVVMVSDQIDGVPLAEIQLALDTGDAPALARLRVMNIEPALVGRRILHSSWWSAFENLFFVSGASAGRILVRPGSELVFVDFEDSGMLPANSKRRFREMFERLGADDVSGAARDLVQVLSPLPYIDVNDFTKRLEGELFQELLALRDDGALWWERTTLGIWGGVMRVARENQIRVSLEVMRFMASTLSYDMCATRLTPRLDLLREFRAYGRQADKRAAKKLVRSIEKLEPEQRVNALVARAGRASEVMLRLGLWVESTTENPPVSYLALSGKAAYGVAQFVRTFGRLALVLGLGILWRVAHEVNTGDSVDLVLDFFSVVRSPWYGTVVFLWLALTIRRVLYRLDDKGD
jgi:ubiquinone biosynthesis protein